MSLSRSGHSRHCASLICFALALPLVFGCSNSTEPLAPGTSPPTPATRASGVIYEGPTTLYDNLSNYHGGSLGSRYVLYDDSTFSLEFYSPRFGPFVYGGRYRSSNSKIMFSWDGWSTAGPWGSEATLHGDSLKVTYNLIMALSDFIDGTYVRASRTP